MNLTCKNCEREFESTVHNKMFCSERCGTAWRNSKRFEGLKEGYDFIRCPDPGCRQKVAEVSLLHAKMHGFSSVRDMAQHYGLPNLKCERIREKMKGKKQSRIRTWR